MSNNHGGSRSGSGNKIGTIKQMLLDNNTAEMIAEQLHDKLKAGEVEIKDLIQLLNFFVTKLKATELKIDQDEKEVVDLSQLTVEELKILSDLEDKIIRRTNKLNASQVWLNSLNITNE